MRWSLLLMLVVLLSLAAGRLSAQYDPNCYFPKVGEPGVIDTIYGSETNQELTSRMNTGPASGSDYGSVFISGLPQNPPFLIAVTGGPTFNLHKPMINAKFQLGSKFSADRRSVHFGHFHNRNLIDILDGQTIYWSDEAGNYDSTRYSQLTIKPRTNNEFVSGDQVGLYATYLSQDTVEDVTIGFLRYDTVKLVDDSTYLELYRGGEQLYERGAIAYPDSEIKLGLFDEHTLKTSRIDPIQGDWRGIGRDDFLCGDIHGNLFYYHNDPPFSLTKLATSMFQDTVWYRRDNPLPDSNTSWLGLSYSMQALPKKPGDHSIDLMVQIYYDERLFIFSGDSLSSGHHLTENSASFVMHQPYQGLGSWYAMADCGDMTGSGNHVLYTQAVYNGGESPAKNLFFVMGTALDDKIDMEFENDDGNIIEGDEAWGQDTITADGDNLQDFIIGLGGHVSEKDANNGKSYIGSIQVVHGSRKIPDRTRGVTLSHPQDSGIEVYPNPLRSTATLSFFSDGRSHSAQVILRDLLGKAVYQTTISIGVGLQEMKLIFGDLASGSYRLEVAMGDRRLTKQVVIVR